MVSLQRALRRNATQKALGQPVPEPPPVDSAAPSAEEKMKTEVRRSNALSFP